jgi:predicted ribosomally synthesized peptide with nif11-like leader
MSKEKFKAFSEEVSLDENLQETVKQIKNLSELIKVARAKGFYFTVEDIAKGLQDLNNLEKKWVDSWNSTSTIPGSAMPKIRSIPPELLGLPYFSEDIQNLAKDYLFR